MPFAYILVHFKTIQHLIQTLYICTSIYVLHRNLNTFPDTFSIYIRQNLMYLTFYYPKKKPQSEYNWN